MNDLQVFSFEGSKVRTVVRDDGPRWVLADVCDALGVVNSRNTAARLDESEKGVSSVDTRGGPQKMALVNESGLYTVLMSSRSRSEQVRRFKYWLAHEVIPAIERRDAERADLLEDRHAA